MDVHLGKRIARTSAHTSVYIEAMTHTRQMELLPTHRERSSAARAEASPLETQLEELPSSSSWP